MGHQLKLQPIWWSITWHLQRHTAVYCRIKLMIALAKKFARRSRKNLCNQPIIKCKQMWWHQILTKNFKMMVLQLFKKISYQVKVLPKNLMTKLQRSRLYCNCDIPMRKWNLMTWFVVIKTKIMTLKEQLKLVVIEDFIR